MRTEANDQSRPTESGCEQTANLAAQLRTLIGQLKQRCLDAESRVAVLQQTVERQQAQIASLEEANATLEQKYQHLQTGLDATGDNPEALARLKAQYLAMVSELDDCIATLQHG